MTEIKRLDWDSDFFELEVGELITNSSNLVVNSDFDLIYVKSDIKTDVEIPGFEKSFTENKVVYQKNLEQVNDSNSAIKEISEIKYSVEELYELAFESGKHSRFKLDKKIDNLKFEELYQIWIENSLNRKFADGFLVYLEENKIIGFVTYKINDNFATIGLIAVSQNHQGKGIGKQLINKVENDLVNKKINELRIPTQEENFQACGFYEKLGYQTHEKITLSHYWKR
jgi:dTDP-4-amino-4,6-dideoxy-D-galactose acyltransferase